MKTSLECLPCFLRQTLYGVRLATSSQSEQKTIMEQVCRLLAELDHTLTPPENSIKIYQTISDLSGCEDPFLDLKKESNHLALSLIDQIREAIESTADPLQAAIRFSIAGNVIDYGSQQSFDSRTTIRECLEKDLVIDHYREMRKDLLEVESILYLGDNSGEIVLDRLVIEELGKKVVFAVKEKPIINDALYADACFSGLDEICRIISNGTSCPGTPLALCSAEFKEEFNRADMIISKGQGNFETLSEVKAPIYFLLTVKCPIVAEHITELTDQPVKSGDMALLKSPLAPNKKSGRF